MVVGEQNLRSDAEEETVGRFASSIARVIAGGWERRKRSIRRISGQFGERFRCLSIIGMYLCNSVITWCARESTRWTFGVSKVWVWDNRR